MELNNKIKVSGWERGSKYQKHYNSSSSDFLVIDAAVLYLEDKSEWHYPIGRITYHNKDNEFWGTIMFPYTRKNAYSIRGKTVEAVMLKLNIFLFEYDYDIKKPL